MVARQIAGIRAANRRCMVEYSRFMKSYSSIFRSGSGWAAFITGILVWGIGMGCFQAAFNNFLVDMYDIDGVDRGVLEFLRETPGVNPSQVF